MAGVCGVTVPRVVCGFLLAAILAGFALADGGTVAFVQPRHLETIVGDSEAVLRVDPPPGKTVSRVDVSVDGKPLATLTAPPWKTRWDAGDGSRGRTLVAVATFSDGSTATATVSTSRLRINAVEDVDLVNLYLVVRDRDGNYVKGLRAEDFETFEDGRKQRIKVFSAEPKPLAIAIVLDTSLTMEGRKIEAAQESALAFLKSLGERDDAMVMAFSDGARVLQPLTADREALARAVQGVSARGGTALYDAIWEASERLRDQDRRRVLVLLSDGRDEAASGLEPGSLHTLSEALDHALRCEVMVFAIGFGTTSELERLDFSERFSQAQILNRLGESTGGKTLYSRRTSALREAFESVAEDLRNQYVLAYTSDNDREDGAWREIRVVPKSKPLIITTRSGYFARDAD